MHEAFVLGGVCVPLCQRRQAVRRCPPSAPAEVGKPGAILCEFFQGIGGDRAADLVNSSVLPDACDVRGTAQVV